MSHWSDRRKELNTALRKHAVPVLRGQGFTGSFPHFRLAVEDRLHVIGFQFSSYGPQFFIEIGIAGLAGSTFGAAHYPAATIKHYQSHCRRRIGDVPFDYATESIEAVARRAAIAITQADPAWQQAIEQWKELKSFLER